MRPDKISAKTHSAGRLDDEVRPPLVNLRPVEQTRKPRTWTSNTPRRGKERGRAIFDSALRDEPEKAGIRRRGACPLVGTTKASLVLPLS